MSWTVPRFSRSKVDAAGQYLILPPGPFEFLEDKTPQFHSEVDVMEVVNNWRASHNWPLHQIRRRLGAHARIISPQALTAQRIKRLESIGAKLRRSQDKHLKLTQIQDIGGCRAIMPHLEEARQLALVCKGGGLHQADFVRESDYIIQPKADGYRSIHLVYKYRGDSDFSRSFENHRIEVQIRTALQHSWATTVETVETLADIPIRNLSGSMRVRPKEAISKWRRLFVLMGSAIALLERCPIVIGTPSTRDELADELRTLDAELNVADLLGLWSATVMAIPIKWDPSAHWFLLRLDTKEKHLIVESFKEADSMKAFDRYVTAEAPERDAPSTNVVLVSIDSMGDLRKAYPNYWADTGMFVNILRHIIDWKP